MVKFSLIFAVTLCSMAVEPPVNYVGGTFETSTTNNYLCFKAAALVSRLSFHVPGHTAALDTRKTWNSLPLIVLTN